MKKKLIQVLMLMVAAVSIGTFMSCKDTNEDLYNELRQETTTSDESLTQRLNDLEATILALKQSLGQQVGTLSGNVADLSNLVNTINTILGEIGDGNKGIEDAEIKYGERTTTLITLLGEILNTLNEHGNNITDLLSFQTTASGQLSGLRGDLDALQSKVDAIKSCECDFTDLWKAIHDIEKDVASVKTKAKDAYNLATSAQTAASGAEKTAGEAKIAADAATQIANIATQVANTAVEIANSALDKSSAAAVEADKAAEIAQKAIELATNANNIAITLESRVEANERDIEKLQENVGTLRNDITELQTKISDHSTQIGINTHDIQSNLDKINKNIENIEKNAQSIEENYRAIQKNKEDIEKLDTRITTVDEKAAEALQRAIDADAKATLNALAIAGLEPRIKANEKAVIGLMTTVDDLLERFGEIKTQVGVNKTNIEKLLESLHNLSGKVTEMGEKIQTLVGDVNELKTDLAAVKAECAANLVKAEAYADTKIAAAIAIAKYEIMSALCEKLEKYYTKNEIDAMIKGLNISIGENTSKIAGLDEKVGTIETNVGKNTERINAIDEILKNISGCECDKQALNDAIEEIQTQLQVMWTNEEIADTIKNKINETIANLINTTIKDVQEELGGQIDSTFIILDSIKVSVTDVKNITDAIIAKAEADSTNFKNGMDAITDSIKSVLSTMTALQTSVSLLEKGNFVTGDSLANYASKKELAEMQNTLAGRINADSTRIDNLDKTVSTITGQITTLQNDYETLKGRMDTAEKTLNTVLGDVNKLKSDVAAIQDYLAKQVSSIIVQGTYNPMFGSFSLPTGSQSNILLAFYGFPSTDVEFPTSRTSNYVRAEEALTEKDMEMLGIDQFMWPANAPLMYDKGYAGKIYMTINPNTADVSGLQPKIVNSADEDSYITLTPIQPSTEKLQFGWTRADQSSNGFYEAEARVRPTDVQKINAPSFNTSAMLDAAKNVRDALTELAENQSVSGTGSKLEKVASDVSTIVKGMRFDRSALKVSYETEDGQGAKTEHSVYSQYDLAATAFQPLNLKTAKDLNFSGIPGFSKVNSLLDKLSNEVHNRVHFFFKDFNNSTLVEKLVNLQINNIEVPEISEDMLAEFILHMDTTFVMDGLSYHLVLPIEEDIPIKIDKNLTIPIDIEGVEFEVPVHFEQDVDVDVTVDLSELYITTPFIRVTGTGEGHIPSGEGILDNEGNLVTELVIPIINNETGELEGYTTIPMENFKVTTTIDADNTSQAGQKIYLEGEALATATTNITIDDIVSGTVDIHKDVYYNLVLEETFHFSTTIDKWFYFGDNGTDKKSFNLVFSYDMTKSAKDLWGMAADALGNVNEMLDDVRDILDEINNALAEINKYEDKITSTFDNVLDKVRTYLDKINSKVTNFINSTNDRFQPFMVASTDKGMKRLSGSKGYPTKLTKDIKLYATSQTMELFVPLARKHVAVTNVFKGSASAQGGNADCKSKLNAANGSGKMNKVVDGNVREIAVNGLVSGYVYEIAYSALDFEGNIATRKYYVTVE